MFRLCSKPPFPTVRFCKVPPQPAVLKGLEQIYVVCSMFFVAQVRNKYHRVTYPGFNTVSAANAASSYVRPTPAGSWVSPKGRLSSFIPLAIRTT